MSKRVLIIGLDGADWRILDPLMAEGRMPNLKTLVDQGSSGPLRTTVPPITVPAWSSLMTGKNPAKHGIYEFLLKKPGAYEEVPINSRSRRARTIWRILSETDRKVVCLNVPTTYPPEEVNGVMVSGFLTMSGARDFVSPKELLPELEERFGPYYLYMKTKILGACMNDATVTALVEDCRAMLEYKTRVACYLAEKEKPDVLMTHIWGTDRLQHELWDILDPTHPASTSERVERHLDTVKDYYTCLDDKIGEMRAAMGEDVCTIVMSDHGFGPIYKAIDLNWWLYEQGYLAFKRKLGTRFKLWLWKLGMNWGNLLNLLLKITASMKPQNREAVPFDELTMFRIGKKMLLLSMADVDWSRTRAYAKTGMGQIYLNVAGREPEGCVQPGEEYETVRSEIVERLAALTDPETGNPVGGDVYRREDIYSGGVIEQCPDITFIAQDQGYIASSLTGVMSNKPFFHLAGFYGNHTMNGILVMHDSCVRKGFRVEEASILDVAPTVLHLAGVPVPDGMDGHVLTETLTELYVRSHPVETVPDSDEDLSGGEGQMSAEEEADVLEKLRDLGYVA